MTKKIISMLLAAAMLFSLAACTGIEPAADPAPAAESLPVEEDAGTYIFTDDIGRSVEVPANISRIVPSGPLTQIILFAIAPEMFVGLASQWNDSAGGIVDDKYFDLPYLGQLYGSADLNVEQLALAGPQLIIDIGEPKDSTGEDLDALQAQTTIPSVFISATLKTMPETYRTLGKLLGKEEKGEQLAQFCEKVYSRTVSIMEKVGDNKVNALYVLGEEGLNVLASGSYHAELIDMLTNNLAVVDNPVSKGLGNEVSMEQLVLWNPEFVVFDPNSIYDTVSSRETWSQISAIVSGSFVEIPDAPDNWMGMPPSVQRYLGMIWLTAILYPEYCDYDVKADILEYYELFYGCALTDEQYDALTANAFLR